MDKVPATRIEFYKRGGGLIEATRGFSVPRNGEYININKRQWVVAYVSWAIDETPRGKEIRANVELEKVQDNEVGPRIEPPEEGK